MTRFTSDAKLARAAGTAPIPASSGRTQRHRLDHGGNRQINCALHRLAVTKGRLDPETAAYLARRQAEGKTRREAIRCLKRHLARRVWHLLQPDPATTIPTSTPSLPQRVMTIHCNRPTGTLAVDIEATSVVERQHFAVAVALEQPEDQPERRPPRGGRSGERDSRAPSAPAEVAGIRSASGTHRRRCRGFRGGTSR